MQVDGNELDFILENKRWGFFNIVTDRLNLKGMNVTRQKVVNEITKRKKEHDPAIIEEAREVLVFQTGKSYQEQTA